MPPKPKCTREEIVEAAFQLTREAGIESVVARALGKRLNATATPVFTLFSSMDEVKALVVEKAKKVFMERFDGLFECDAVTEEHPAFKEFGMRFVRFAFDEPWLYKLLFMVPSDSRHPFDEFKASFEGFTDSLVTDIERSFQISKADAEELFEHMMIHAKGIIAFSMEGDSYSEGYISDCFTQVCMGLVITMRVRDGMFDLKEAESMARLAYRPE